MPTYIWRASGNSPAEIQVTLDQRGLGWFTAYASTATGGQTDLVRKDPNEADGDALFRVTPNGDLFFEVEAYCADAPPGKVDVLLEVRQSGAILNCTDARGQVINPGGQPVKVGQVAQARALAFTFQIWN